MKPWEYPLNPGKKNYRKYLEEAYGNIEAHHQLEIKANDMRSQKNQYLKDG